MPDLEAKLREALKHEFFVDDLDGLGDALVDLCTQVARDHYASEVERLREALELVREAFSFMPALHGAVSLSDYTVDLVRDEVNASLDWCLPAVRAALNEEADRAALSQKEEPRLDNEGFCDHGIPGGIGCSECERATPTPKDRQ